MTAALYDLEPAPLELTDAEALELFHALTPYRPDWVVLATIKHGSTITHLPTWARVIGHAYTYGAALELAQARRVHEYRGPQGQRLVIDETARGERRAEWAHAFLNWEHRPARSYALALHRDDLEHYEPERNP